MSVDRTLFEIGKDMRALDALLDEVEGDVSGVEEIVYEWFQENESNLEEKIDGYHWYLKELGRRAEALKAEEKELRKQRKVYQNRADRLKDHLQWFMESSGIDEIEGEKHKAKLQGAGGKRPVEIDEAISQNPEAIPGRYQRVRIRPDKTSIREALEDGEDLEFARLGERGKYVRFY